MMNIRDLGFFLVLLPFIVALYAGHLHICFVFSGFYAHVGWLGVCSFSLLLFFTPFLIEKI